MKYLLAFFIVGFFISCTSESTKCDSKLKGKFGIYETVEFTQIEEAWMAADELSRPEEGFEEDSINISFDQSFDDFMIEELSLEDFVVRMDWFIGYVRSDEDKLKVEEILNRPDIKILFEPSLKFLWSAKKEIIDYKRKKRGWYLYCCRMPENNKAKINESHISKATTGYDQINGDITVNLSMTDAGADLWSRMTRENVDRIIAITINDVVYCAPVVRSVINNGVTQISGDFTHDEAEKLACLLNKGS